MKRRMNKRKYTLLIVFLLLDLMLILAIFNSSNARFTSKATSQTMLDVALYAFSEDNDLTITLDKMVPQDEPYVYKFSVSNLDENGVRTDTKMFYDLKVITTTNIPLEYKLCMDVDYCQTADSVVNVDEIVADADGTYFRTMTTDREYFGFDKDYEHNYILLVYFPSKYNSDEYQDLVESIQINIDSKQCIDECN